MQRIFFAPSFAFLAFLNVGCMLGDPLSPSASLTPSTTSSNQWNPPPTNTMKEDVPPPQPPPQPPTEVIHCKGRVCVLFEFSITSVEGNLSKNHVSKLKQALVQVLNNTMFPDENIEQFEFVLDLYLAADGRCSFVHQEGFPTIWDEPLREALKKSRLPIDRPWTELHIKGSALLIEKNAP